MTNQQMDTMANLTNKYYSEMSSFTMHTLSSMLSYYDNERLRMNMFIFSLENENKVHYRLETIERTLNNVTGYTEADIRQTILKTGQHFVDPKIIVTKLKKGVSLLDKPYVKEVDISALSTALQMNVNHKIRITKNDTKITDIPGNIPIIVVNSNEVTMDMINKIISMMPALAPDQEYKLSDKAIDIILTPTEDWDEYLTKVTAYLNNTNIMKLRLTQSVKRALKNSAQATISSLNTKKANIETKLRNGIEYYRLDSIELDGVLAKLSAIENTAEEGHEDLINYILSNKCIVDVRPVSNAAIGLDILNFLTAYDKQVMAKYLKNPNSIVFSRSQDVKEILKALFIDETYSLQLCTRITITFPYMYKAEYMNFGTSKIALVNPHLTYHNCWGSNGMHIQRALSEGNYIAAIEQMVGAAHNVNFLDPTVFKKFLADISASITTSTGALVHCYRNNTTGEMLTAKGLLQELNSTPVEPNVFDEN